MIEPTHFDRVRIVQDQSAESELGVLYEDQQGPKFMNEVLDAGPDSLLPLQGALGYEIYQPLFVGRNCLVVEGTSDLLYIQTISALLQEEGKSGLASEWTVTPVGGSDKVPTFVALLSAQSRLKVAVLIDFQKKHRQTVENLYKKKLLKKKNVLTYADYVESDEADIEDMFEATFYLKLVNKTFGTCLTVNELPKGSPRIVRRLEQHFKKNALPDDISFNHYRPALYLNELAGSQIERFQKAFTALNKLV